MGGESSKAEAAPPVQVDTRLLLWCSEAIDPVTSSIPWVTVLAALDGSNTGDGGGQRLLDSFLRSRQTAAAAAATPAGSALQSTMAGGDESMATVDDVVAFIASVMGVTAPEPPPLAAASTPRRPPASASARLPIPRPTTPPSSPAAKRAAAIAAVLHAAYADAADGLLSREGAARMFAHLYSVALVSPALTSLPPQDQEHEHESAAAADTVNDACRDNTANGANVNADAAGDSGDGGGNGNGGSVGKEGGRGGPTAAPAPAPAPARTATVPEAALDALWGVSAGPSTSTNAGTGMGMHAVPRRMAEAEFVARIQATLPRLPTMAAAWCERQLLGPVLELLDNAVKAAATVATAAATEAEAASTKAGKGDGKMTFTAAAALADAAAEASQALTQAKQTYGMFFRFAVVFLLCASIFCESWLHCCCARTRARAGCPIYV